MYYEGSHFTFWNEFSTEKKIFNCTKHYGLHIKEYWKMINNLMKELGKKQKNWFNRIETNYSHFLLTLMQSRCNLKSQLDHGGLESQVFSQ